MRITDLFNLLTIDLTIIIPILFGLIVLIVGITKIVKHLILKKKCTESTTGVVEGTYEEPNLASEDPDDKVHIIVRYKTDQGAFGEDLTTNGHFASAPKIGEKVKIKYNPKAPTQFYIEGSKIIPSTILAMVFCLAIIAFVLYSFLK